MRTLVVVGILGVSIVLLFLVLRWRSSSLVQDVPGGMGDAHSHDSSESLSHLVKCGICGSEHDLSNIEPSLIRADPVLEVPKDQFAERVVDSKDSAVVRDTAQGGTRYFLRVMMPFTVDGRPIPINWGIWVEVDAQDFSRAWERWDDPDQGNEPPFPGELANTIVDYPETVGLRGIVQLRDPQNVPTFTLEESDHPFAIEQRIGVTEEIVVKWLDPMLHPTRD